MHIIGSTCTIPYFLSYQSIGRKAVYRRRGIATQRTNTSSLSWDSARIDDEAVVLCEEFGRPSDYVMDVISSVEEDTVVMLVVVPHLATADGPLKRDEPAIAAAEVD